jgi:hypothetical protein
LIVSIHQPAYLPWLGYLARIAASDVFIFLDTVQFEKNSFINRNRVKTAGGSHWLTIPLHVRGHLGATLLDMEIDNRRDWRRKHLRTIDQSYRRAPHFAANAPRLAALFDATDNRLTELCFRQLHFWLEEFGVRTRVVRASQLPVTGRKSELVLALCQHLGATTYLAGPQGRSYLEEERFEAQGIQVTYHQFNHPEYPQLYGEFIPAMSVVDYWMNCGGSSMIQMAP